MRRPRAPAAFVPLVDDFAARYLDCVEDWMLSDLAKLYGRAEARLLALDAERKARLSAGLEGLHTAEESDAAFAVSADFAARVARAVRVARNTSQFEIARPSECNRALLRVMLDVPEEWPDSALYAVLALADTILAAENGELARTYTGAACEALALADRADARDALGAPAQAKREARRARVAEFTALYKQVRPACASEKAALREICESMKAGMPAVESYKREALAAGLL